jgi:hypothetical protein
MRKVFGWKPCRTTATRSVQMMPETHPIRFVLTCQQKLAPDLRPQTPSSKDVIIRPLKATNLNFPHHSLSSLLHLGCLAPLTHHGFLHVKQTERTESLDTHTNPQLRYQLQKLLCALVDVPTDREVVREILKTEWGAMKWTSEPAMYRLIFFRRRRVRCTYCAILHGLLGTSRGRRASPARHSCTSLFREGKVFLYEWGVQNRSSSGQQTDYACLPPCWCFTSPASACADGCAFSRQRLAFSSDYREKDGA